MMIKDAFEEIFKDVHKVLVVMPHPDDCELYCGGTVARLVQLGKVVRVAKMTYGEKGCRQDKVSPEELKLIRKNEDTKSMRILGIDDGENIYLDLGDGQVEADIETIGVIAKQIRTFRPDLIITTNPEDMIIRFDKNINWINHRDHINTGKAVLYGSYPYSRDISFFPEHFADKKLKSHICTKFLLTDYYDHPDNVLIDVTETLDIRINAHAAHSSQYSREDSKASAEFFTQKPSYPDGKSFEKFRYVIVD
jgi:LmbE family N-acetylglucosaminyl deacetylase